MPRRSYAGAAPATALASPITASSTSITVTNGTGYPTGGAGPFFVVIDAGKANEEKVLVTSRSGNVLTCTLGNRGSDSTTAATHDSGAVVQHVFTATDADEANAHVNGDGTGLHIAADITFTPTGTLAATDVQTALAELDSEKSATGHSHSATKTFRLPHTWALDGQGSTIPTGVRPGFEVPAPAGQAAVLYGLRYQATGGSGTATVQVRHNGSTIETLSCTTTAQTELTGLTLADLDDLDINVTVSAATIIRVTALIDYTV